VTDFATVVAGDVCSGTRLGTVAGHVSFAVTVLADDDSRIGALILAVAVEELSGMQTQLKVWHAYPISPQLKQAPVFFLGSVHSLDICPARRGLVVDAEDGKWLKSLTLSTIVAGIRVKVLVDAGSRPTIGSSLLGLQSVQLGLVLLAALVGSPVFVGEGSVAHIAVMSGRMDGLEAVVRVRGKDVSHVGEARRARCLRSKQGDGEEQVGFLRCVES
jgi:hypothetical protein